MSHEFRLNQTVLCIGWKKGVPFLKTGKITKVTKQSYYVDNEKTKSSGWCATVNQAIDAEYLSLFHDWDFMFGGKRRPKDWTVEDTVACVVRLRRLQRRLTRKRSG